jgi:hypothetical protein
MPDIGATITRFGTETAPMENEEAENWLISDDTG